MSESGSNRNPFRKGELDYCELIASIGRPNSSNLSWWSSSLSSKNFGDSDLWQNICQHIETGRKQEKKYGLFRNIRATAEWIYRTRIIAPHKLRIGHVKKLSEKTEKLEYLFFTHFSPEAFDWSSGNYQDRFWTPLTDVLDKRGQRYAMVGINHGKEREIAKFLINRNCTLPTILPIEAFISPIDIAHATLLAYFIYPKIPRHIDFRGRNISEILKRQFSDERFSGQIMRNVSLYFAFRKLLKKLKPKKIYWPWENHSWEHLLCMASIIESPNTKRIGFQHTAVPPFLLNHFPGVEECDYAPMPDRIITVGKISKNILETLGHFPKDMILEGCAIRHQHLFERRIESRHRTSVKKLGVALSISAETSDAIIKTMGNAFGNREEEILFRFHPLCPKELIPYVGVILDKFNNLRISPTEPMEIFLKNCDTLIYADSTVGFEAIFSGIPVIYLEVDKMLNMDALFQLDSFKWSVKSSEELISAISDIKELTDAEYFKQQKDAQEYAKAYFNPISDEGIEKFLNA